MQTKIQRPLNREKALLETLPLSDSSMGMPMCMPALVSMTLLPMAMSMALATINMIAAACSPLHNPRLPPSSK